MSSLFIAVVIAGCLTAIVLSFFMDPKKVGPSIFIFIGCLLVSMVSVHVYTVNSWTLTDSVLSLLGLGVEYLGVRELIKLKNAKAGDAWVK